MKVAVWPEAGETVESYLQEGIKLNNVPAVKVIKLYSFWKRQYYLVAFFNKEDAINSLGQVELYQSYPVILSGSMVDGTTFGGAYNVKIVR